MCAILKFNNCNKIFFFRIDSRSSHEKVVESGESEPGVEQE
jgi:hypothetical protein